MVIVLNVIKNIFIANNLFLILLLITFVSDFISGIAKAIKNKNFKSSKLRGCVSKFLCYISSVIIGIVIEILFNIPALKIITSFLIITETISVIENMNELGVKIPEKIVNLLKGNVENEKKK